MKKLEKKIIKLIKASDGTNWEDIASKLNRTRKSLRKARAKLYQEGYIANYYGCKVDVFYRSIDVYEKGCDIMLSEKYHVHGIMKARAEVLVEEIGKLSNTWRMTIIIIGATELMRIVQPFLKERITYNSTSINSSTFCVSFI
jgi:hypothetical protein